MALETKLTNAANLCELVPSLNLRDDMKGELENIALLNNNLINAHFPIVTIQKDSMMSTKNALCQIPAVPKGVDTFINRFVNKFLLMTNRNQNERKICRAKRSKQKQINTKLNTQAISDDSSTVLDVTSRKRPQPDASDKSTHHNQQCTTCQRYRGKCSTVLLDKIPILSNKDSNELYKIMNTNAASTATNSPILKLESNSSRPKLSIKKLKSLNESQQYKIISAIELIFDTLISNYR